MLLQKRAEERHPFNQGGTRACTQPCSCVGSGMLCPALESVFNTRCLQIFRPALAADMLAELQVDSLACPLLATMPSRCLQITVSESKVFLHLMLDLTNAERSLSNS